MNSPVNPEFDWLNSFKQSDPIRAKKNLSLLAKHLDSKSFLLLHESIKEFFSSLPDPDRSLNNLERFFSQASSKPYWDFILLDKSGTLLDLMQIFSTSQSFSDLLISYPDCIDMLGVPLHQTPSREQLVQELQAEVDKSSDDASVLRALRRYKQRQVLRIGGNDILRNRPLEEVTLDISQVAEAALEVAMNLARKTLERRYGIPFNASDLPASCCILAFGKLGGEELNYSSDIDLMFVYDDDGFTKISRGTPIDNSEFFSRLASEIVRLLSAHTDRGTCYRVDLRLRPEGQRGPLARSLEGTLAYYDTLGRTFERQALIKVRTVAGDFNLGFAFIKSIESFVYRRYLSFAEINEIKALKRRIELQTSKQGLEQTEVKTGRGGIRDIEFTIQFLQLLNGGDLPMVRERNTLKALLALEKAGCLTDQESRVLDDAYRFLRKTEHRLQVLFDLQTHKLPDKDDELSKLAQRMGYFSENHQSPRELFLEEYKDRTSLTHRILEHLLHQTFSGDADQSEPESDIILDPNPEPDLIRAALEKYRFKNIDAAYQNLLLLAQESAPFLSTRRCRHFLASIAPALLKSLRETPDPDMALMNLEKVTASLGAKTILWELFSFNPPSLKLYVDICAWSQFLSGILTNNPGMIDELLDSLVLDQPRNLSELKQELADLCKNATDLDPILHSFQDKELLRIGVRDILGKDPTRLMVASLSDLAETVLSIVADIEMNSLIRKLGSPILSTGPRVGKPCRFAIVGLGKLGGREINYHSDLDLIILYEGEGKPYLPNNQTHDEQQPDNNSFFIELTQRIIKTLSNHGPLGRLYELDLRLRPTGRSGSLVIPIGEFQKYYSDSDSVQLWERLMLSRARVVHGDSFFANDVLAVVTNAVCMVPWKSTFIDEVKTMRDRLEASRNPGDLKRGSGGMADVEFLTELLEIRFGASHPSIRQPNVWSALEAMKSCGLVSLTEHFELTSAYDFLLRVQSRLRIVQNLAIDTIPDKTDELTKLARRLGFELVAFQETLSRHQKIIRQHYLQILEGCR